MSGERNNREKRFPFSPFKEIEQFMNEIMQKVLAEHGEVSFHVYIFFMKDDPNLETIDTVQRSLAKGPISSQVREQQENLIDVFEDKNKVVVVAEVPGINTDDVEVDKSDKVVAIWVNRPQRRTIKDIELSDEVSIKEAKINYKNGVLEVILPKIEKKIDENFSA